MKIKNFTIFGERNSGTKYLQRVLQQNLDIPFTDEYGFKHWFVEGISPRGKINTTTDLEKKKSIFDSDETLFFVTVRNPFDWCGSMYETPYHIKEMKRDSLLSFISSKYISYEFLPPVNNRNTWIKKSEEPYYFIEQSKNLVELRNEKNNHFLNFKKTVKHFALIRQENLIDDLNEVLNNYFGKKLHKLENYRNPKKYYLTQKEKEFILKNLNNQIDNQFYLK